jgi:hypothetical protein
MKNKFFYVLPILILISSCGGGGGGGSSSSDPIISINPIIDTFTSSSTAISEGDSITYPGLLLTQLAVVVVVTGVGIKVNQELSL